MILFLMSVLMTSGFLLQGTATEKENKVVDVLLASANPDEVLSGKLIGLGAAGLLQVTLWFSLLMVGGIGILPLIIAAQVDVPWMAGVLALPLFIASFLFFGSLMMGSGSLGSTMREAQQLAMVWSLTAALPLMMMGPLIQDPHGLLARVLTWIPITSAAVVMFRPAWTRARSRGGKWRGRWSCWLHPPGSPSGSARDCSALASSIQAHARASRRSSARRGSDV